MTSLRMFAWCALFVATAGVTSAHAGALVSAPRTLDIGQKTACAIGSDHVVYCWGEGGLIETLTGKSNYSSVAVPLPGISDAISIAVDDDRVCVLRAKGLVACFDPGKSTRTDVVGLPVIRAIALGRRIGACAVGEDGSLWCWGSRHVIGPTRFPATPTRVAGVAGAVDVAAGVDLVCIVTAAGKVDCTGARGAQRQQSGMWALDSQLTAARSISIWGGLVCVRRAVGARCYGDGSSPAPRADPDLEQAIQSVDAGDRHMCLVSAQGSVACHGEKKHAPSLLTPITDAVEVAAGGLDNACARLRSGSVVCWGEGRFGTLGNGWPRAYLDAQRTKLSEPAVHVATFHDGACAVLLSGGVRCWGSGTAEPHDPLERSSRENDAEPFVAVAPFSTSMGCGLVRGGRVGCWTDGDLDDPRMGDPATHDVGHMTHPNLGKVQRLVSTPSDICALDERGAVTCWGKHAWGGGLRRIAGLGRATSIAVAESYGCARIEDGRVRCWGEPGFSGLRANGALFDLTGVEDAIGVAAGELQVCALRKSKPARCFGAELDGDAKSIAGITTLALAGSQNEVAGCFLDSRKTLACFGSNGSLVGAPATTRPRNVRLAGPVSSWGIGDDFGCAVRGGGDVMCWGAWGEGQLGTGAASYSLRPVPVSGLP